MTILHVMTIRAYQRKPEMGGGFRGVAVVRPEYQGSLAAGRIESGVLPTLEAAKAWAQGFAHKAMGDKPYRRCYIKRPQGSYAACIWEAR